MGDDPMSPKVGERRREEILVVAAALFRERGYSGTTVRDLAREVGITSGSIFHHFGSKEEILFQVVSEGVAETILRVNEARESTSDPHEQLRRMLEAHMLAMVEGSSKTTSVLFYEHWSLTEPLRVRLLEVRDTYERVWDEALGQLGGLYADPVNRRVRRLLLLGAMNWMVQWYRRDGDVGVPEIAESLYQMAIDPAAAANAGPGASVPL